MQLNHLLYLLYDDDSTAVTSYSLQSGSLPGGFTLDGDSSIGTISGTETGSSATTTYTFTIRATDNESQTTDRQFTITVNHALQEEDNLTNKYIYRIRNFLNRTSF